MCVDRQFTSGSDTVGRLCRCKDDNKRPIGATMVIVYEIYLFALNSSSLSDFIVLLDCVIGFEQFVDEIWS